ARGTLDRIGVFPVQESAGPGRIHLRDEISPKIVILRAFDGVVFSIEEIDDEAPSEGLDVGGIGGFGGVGLAGLGAAFGSGNVFGSGHREEIAELGGVEKIVADEFGFVSFLKIPDDDGVDAVAGGLS